MGGERMPFWSQPLLLQGNITATKPGDHPVTPDKSKCVMKSKRHTKLGQDKRPRSMWGMTYNSQPPTWCTVNRLTYEIAT